MPMTPSPDGSTNAELLERRRSTAPHRARSGPKPEREKPAFARNQDTSILAWWDAFAATKPGSMEAAEMLDGLRGETTCLKK